MHLSTFLDLPTTSRAVLASQVGVTEKTLARYASRQRWPEVRVALLIERHTAGTVPVASWAADWAPEDVPASAPAA